MTGSIRTFGYLDDAGVQRYVKLDESVAESAPLGLIQNVPAAILADYGNRVSISRSRPIEPRYVLCTRTAAGGGQVKRKFIVGSVDATAWDAATNQITVDGEQYSITAKIGEKRYLEAVTDTAQLDGDLDAAPVA